MTNIISQRFVQNFVRNYIPGAALVRFDGGTTF